MFDVDHDPADAIKPAVGYRVDYRRHSVLHQRRHPAHRQRHPVGQERRRADPREGRLPGPDTAGYPERLRTPHQPAAGRTDLRAYEPQDGRLLAHRPRGAAAHPNVPPNVIAQRTRETYSGPLTIGEDLTRFVIDRRGVAVIPHYAENE
jgi:ribonuclease Z